MKHFWPAIYMVLVSCSSTMECPKVRDGKRIAVLDHGRHTSLLLQKSEIESLRFSYGDWSYYAKSKDDLFTGLKALLWPTQATLGRKSVMISTFNQDEIQDSLSIYIEEMTILKVEEEKLFELLHNLDQLYQKGSKSRHYNPSFDLIFVKHPSHYSIVSNSNAMIAKWLKQLGCEKHSLIVFANWKIKQP